MQKTMKQPPTLRATGDKVVVQMLPKEKSRNGILLPETQIERSGTALAKVLSVGSKCSTDIQKDMTVIVAAHLGLRLDNDVRIYSEEDIIAIHNLPPS